MFGKKGMSPLIATILLMAFAVALGGVIMRIGTELPTGDDCKAITLQINKFCRSEDGIALSLRNIGEMDIAEVRLIIKDSSTRNEIAILDSAISQGMTLGVTIPTTASSEADVRILPAILVDDETIACAEPIPDVGGVLDEC